ncbi:hypothetical protein OF385_02585 [Glutamicibacter sp. JL.03c]|uniref:hypothetical protein n=1 Tax=Glutamicibacter sp. JL.03c TaxID=2984842 RepID=UPI0021F6D1BC|nr:hypothetical protein [Glutamicibacter sp. JL.03c]UYQ78076.1 hypothetical protein OF385_02585 [Glutamicibacter sp. JL.03c]
MAKKPPNSTDRVGGWASMENEGSSIGLPGGCPLPSTPIIEQAAGGLPKVLKARYYFWMTPPTGTSNVPNLDVNSVRRLAAIDVIISMDDSNHLGILLSTRNRQQLNRRDGVLKSLEDILKANDNTIKIDRSDSHLELCDTDIFLWLTVQRRDKPQIAPDLRLDKVSGISGKDASARTADLRAGVDFDRPNFLTAVAEADTLGPIDISFVQDENGSLCTFRVQVHLDGGFAIRKSDVHIPGITDDRQLMETASLRLAFELIPRLNGLYVSDAADWETRRLEVIQSAMTELESRYRAAREALLERIVNSPEAIDDGENAD